MMIPLLIFLFSLLLVARTGAAGVINLGDSLFPFFPNERFGNLLYLWEAHSILGNDSSVLVSQLPWYGLVALLDRLGVSLWIGNRLWFVLPFLLLGLSMYFLSGVVFGKGKKSSRFIASLFFMFNPFTLSLISGSSILTLSFAAGVFVFGLFARGLGKDQFEVRNALLIGLVSVFATANIVVWVMTLLLCALYLLFFVAVNRKSRQILVRSFKFLLFAFCFLLLVNSWWLLPFAYQFLTPGYFGTLFSSGTDVSTLEFITRFTSLFDVSRLFYGMTPTANFPISNYYHYLLAPTMMSVLVVLVFLATLFKKKSKFEIFFLLLALFSVILASGTRPPFGFVYQFLWDHIPYFHIFRTTNRFNLYTMISYAVLLGFFYQHCKDGLGRDSGRLTKYHHGGILSAPKFSRFFIASFLLFSILLSSWPLLSGDLYGQLKPHQIPQDYYELREFLQNQDGDFRVMSLPQKDWLTPYTWSAPFDMQEILIDFSPKDTVINPVGYLQDLMNRDIEKSDPIYAMVYRYPERPEALDALRLMGVRFLIVHRDYAVVWGNYYTLNVSKLKEALRKIEGIKFVKSFGDLDVYEVADFRLRIYSTSGRVSYERVNPTEYRIGIKGATEPFTLVLTENFHPGWKSSSGKHIKFADFANGWEISPEDRESPGDYEVVLKYRPQKLFDIGLAISILSLVVGLSSLLYLKLGKK